MESAEPAWLDEKQLQSWIRFVGMITILPAELDTEMQRTGGLTQFEYSVLAALSDAPEHTLRISRLAAFARGSLSRMSHLIKRLEGRGWVRRELDPEDGRYTNAILTDEGYALIVRVAPDHVAVVRRLVVDALTPAQFRQLGEISQKIIDRVAPDGDCPTGH